MSEWDWKSLVKTIAPGIASVFGTPLAGMGVTALLDAILPTDAAKPTNPEAYLAKALQSVNPEMLLKIKTADQAFALEMKKLDIDVMKLAQQNTDGARTLKMEWLKSNKFDYEPILAFLVVAAFGYSEYWVFANAPTAALSTDMSMMVGRMLGIIDSAFMLLLTFRWGSSSSSERKTELAAAEQLKRYSS
jgi:hypothetical protein